MPSRSLSVKKNAGNRKPPTFEDVPGETVAGDQISARLPRSRIAVLARPGMAILGEGTDNGQIIACTAEHCIASMESGKEIAMRWSEVVLMGASPDPKYLLRRK